MNTEKNKPFSFKSTSLQSKTTIAVLLMLIIVFIFASIFISTEAIHVFETTFFRPSIPPTQSDDALVIDVLSPKKADESTRSGQLHNVISVTDGDTFKVLINGKSETVRIVGINTPETVDPRKPVECFGKQASDRLKELIEHRSVELEPDETQSDRDKYNRLLRFVTVDDRDVGKIMIEEGYAYEALYSSTPHRKQAEYLQAQQAAKQEKRGLWAEDACDVLTGESVKETPTIPAAIDRPVVQSPPTPTPTAPSENQTGTIQNSDVGSLSQDRDCNGPDLDCSDFATQSEAQVFFDNCGWNKEIDPMRLDSVGLGDGIACESLP